MLSTAPAVEIEQWVEGMNMYDRGDTKSAIDKFDNMTRSGRTTFNSGCCYLALGDFNAASKSFQECVEFDKHLAIGYFMLGLSNCVRKCYEESLDNFKVAYELLRGNKFVDYRQLGLKYQLYECTILFNQAVVSYKKDNIQEARKVLVNAAGCANDQSYDIIRKGLDRLQAGKGIELIGPPKSEIFRPSKAAMANRERKDYLGKAKVVSTSNQEDIYACFSGLLLLNEGSPYQTRKSSNSGSNDKPYPTSPPLRTRPPAPQKPLPLLVPHMNLDHAQTLGHVDVSKYQRKKLTKQVSKDDSFIGVKQSKWWHLGGRPKSQIIDATAIKKRLSKDVTSSQIFGLNPNLPGSDLKRPDKKLPTLHRVRSNSVGDISEPVQDHYESISEIKKGLLKFSNSISGDDKANICPKSHSDVNDNYILDVTPSPAPTNTNIESNKTEIATHSFNVQITFQTKVSVKEGVSLEDFMGKINSIRIPGNMELIYTDDLGRQRPLTQTKLTTFVENKSSQTLLCFPENSTD